MAGFYYFFRGHNAEGLARGEELNHNLLSHFGLADVLADVRKVPAQASVSAVGSNAGPGGGCGAILTVGSIFTGAPTIVGNAPDRQHWKQLSENGEVWIGVLKNELPRPEDLQRSRVIGGGKVTDPQHYEWIVPVARAVTEGMPYGLLPQSYRFDAKGEPQPVLDPAYEWLWNLSGEVIDWYRAADAGKPRPHAWLVKTAAKLLGVNYRVGLAELNLLHDLGHTILHQTTVGAIAQASYGWEVLEEAKKNEPPKIMEPVEAPTAAS